MSDLSPALPPAHARLSFPIRLTELDRHHRLTIPALVVLIGEAADAGAATVGLGVHELLAQDRAWVLRTLWLRLDPAHPSPAAGEELHIRTFPTTRTTPLRFCRDFLVRSRAPEGEPLARCTTEWIYLDATTRRPLRFRDRLGDLGPHQLDPVLDPEADDPPPLGEPDAPAPAEPARRVTVGHHDIDWNGHVNNAHYVRWALDSAPATLWETHAPTEFRVRFDAEAVLGQEVLARTAVASPSGGGVLALRHHLSEAGSGRTLAVAASRWALRPGP